MGTGVILLGELGTGGEGWEEGLLKSLVRSTQELCPPGGVSVMVEVDVIVVI